MEALLTTIKEKLNKYFSLCGDSRLPIVFRKDGKQEVILVYLQDEKLCLKFLKYRNKDYNYSLQDLKDLESIIDARLEYYPIYNHEYSTTD